jgi:hypothetical protein
VRLFDNCQWQKKNCFLSINFCLCEIFEAIEYGDEVKVFFMHGLCAFIKFQLENKFTRWNLVFFLFMGILSNPNF